MDPTTIAEMLNDTVIALAGNPNSGKTTLFNVLTGARQHVGNYPGVTVEKKEGLFIYNRRRFKVVDLPGTYSLTAYSLEEVVARDYLVNARPAAVINIVDAANLERNLYLTVQFMELGMPVIIALNMMDVAEQRGILIDTQKLSRLLGVPVVATIARRGQGREALAEVAERMLCGRVKPAPLKISYGQDIDEALLEMARIIQEAGFLTETYAARWVALKYLEDDDQVRQLGRSRNPEVAGQLESRVARLAEHLQTTLDTYPEAMIADHRYGYIKSVLRQGIVSFGRDQNRLFVSDRIDKVLTNRFAGPLIMLAVVLGLYHFTFGLGELPVVWLEALFGRLRSVLEAALPAGMLKSMLIAGVIDGVGGVLGFVPLIMFMFMGIAFLEDSGYMARMAFMLDRVFRTFGLHGSSVMPFIISGGIAGGCAVPGIMATRTLKSRRERLATLLTVPFMNCGAKLPVFALLVAAFFAAHKAFIMFLITIVSWIGALLAAKLLRSTVIRGEATPFVMELPPYRLPTFKGLLIHTGERAWQYIRKAGTTILAISILLWALMTFPALPEAQRAAFDAQRQQLTAMQARGSQPGSEAALQSGLERIRAAQAQAALRQSAAGRLGMALEHVTQAAGFDWRTNIALIGGFAAKEIIVSALGTAYALGGSRADQPLSTKLAASPGWGPLTAMSLMIFIMFYTPCLVSVVCIAKESGSWKWAAFSITFNTLAAFVLAVLVFQTGQLMGF